MPLEAPQTQQGAETAAVAFPTQPVLQDLGALVVIVGVDTLRTLPAGMAQPGTERVGSRLRGQGRLVPRARYRQPQWRVNRDWESSNQSWLPSVLVLSVPPPPNVPSVSCIVHPA